MKNRKKLSYPGVVRILLVVLQAAAVLVLAACLQNIRQWMRDSGGLREATGDYLETSLFFRRVDETVEHKIAGQRNLELFEQDGVLDELKEVDLQSFGQPGANFQDLNTTYLLRDLLRFGTDGSLQALQSAVSEAVRDGTRDRTAGEILAERSGELETILPVTEISLAECAKWYTNSADFVLEMYQKLDEVCTSLVGSYVEYTTVQDESWSADAPSNLRYYIGNKVTGEVYTNLDADSYDAACALVSRHMEFTGLFAGERSYNVMVADPERTLGEKAQQWFQGKRYVSTNEVVLLAFDPDFPVMDELQQASEEFRQLGGRMTAAAVTAGIAAAVLAVCFVLSLLSTGHRASRQETSLYGIDQVPSELAMAIYLILGVLLVAAFRGDLHVQPEGMTAAQIRVLLAAAGYLALLSACTGLVRRMERKTLWTNSITRMLVHSWKRVTSTRLLSGRFLVIYVGFFALNLLFLLIFGRAGVVLVLILDVVALLYLLRDLVGKQSVWEGIHKISLGDLEYKIDTSPLQGETYEMAKAINDMGDGLKEAVESMLKNERLKAELITNVSHDLKTPLTSIVNYVDLLKKENPEGERVRAYLEVLDQKSQRLKQLTEDLVEASRISSGNVTLEMMRLPFGSILEQACGEFADRFEQQRIRVSLQVPEQPLYISADGSQLWRVLENLMSNVCKYAKPDTVCTIHLAPTGEMPPGVQMVMENETEQELHIAPGTLTERFVRGDASRSTEGSGLGLSIAASLTELMGGTLTVKAEGFRFAATLVFLQQT